LDVLDTANAFNSLDMMVEAGRAKDDSVAFLGAVSEHLEGISIPNDHLELWMINTTQEFIFLTIVLLVDFALVADCLGVGKDKQFFLAAEPVVDVQLACLHPLPSILQYVDAGVDGER
jgi:hypothetical protein